MWSDEHTSSGMDLSANLVVDEAGRICFIADEGVKFEFLIRFSTFSAKPLVLLMDYEMKCSQQHALLFPEKSFHSEQKNHSKNALFPRASPFLQPLAATSATTEIPRR
jgi:hypothetical protein